MQELEAENRALWEEKKLASGILTKYKEEEKVVDDALKAILTERRRIKDLQDEVYGRLQETRRVQRAKLDDFYDNRRMSQMFAADEGYRRHYNLLWQQQRNQPISLGGDCNLGTGYVEPTMEPSPPSKKADKGAPAAGGAREALSSIGGKPARSREPELSEEEQKAKVREQNRVAAEEAEARKERRRRDQEKKKAKAQDKRQQKEAAEKQRLEAEAAAAAAKAAEPEAADEGGEEAAAASSTNGTAAAQDDTDLQPSFGRAGPKPRPRSKKAGFDVRTTWQKYSTQIMTVVAIVVALVGLQLCYSLFEATTA
ncbi:hypothetical protein WJX84_006677 [Apatococcus fuscideae]|uniref:Uncharacterized protein n=1 Tax=Apatococcus fuscideae TaxID=2026836 RepID=A0AAW1S7U8_9CHLO